MLKGSQIYPPTTRWSTRIQSLLPPGPQFCNYSSAGRFVGLLESRHVFVVLSKDATRLEKERILRPNSPFGICIFDRRRDLPMDHIELEPVNNLTLHTMSVTPALRASARSAYRDLLRASATTFHGMSCYFSSVDYYLTQVCRR